MIGERWRGQARIVAEDSVQFLRPDDGVGFRVPLPTAHVGDRLRLLQFPISFSQCFLGPPARGDILRCTSQHHDPAAGVANRFPACREPSLAAVRVAKLKVEFVRHSGFKQAIHGGNQPRPALRCEDPRLFLGAQRRPRGIHAENTISLLGPDSGVRVRNELPAAHLAHTLRFPEFRFAPPQRRLRSFAGADISGNRACARNVPICAPDRRNCQRHRDVPPVFVNPLTLKACDCLPSVDSLEDIEGFVGRFGRK